MNTKKEKFFYAEVEAGVYDATIELTTPYYAVAVETMDYLVTEYIKKYSNNNSKVLVLDIGAGTGNESIKILKKFPFVEVLAIDFCEPMELEYHKNWVKIFSNNEPKRYEYWVENFINCNVDKFMDFFSKNDKKGFDIIITAYTMHHYIDSEKYDFYMKIYSLLANNGLFINIDLFNYNSNELSDIANDQIINFIKTQFKNPDEIYTEAKKVPLERRLSLSERWVNHYQNDNLLTPIEIQRNMLIELGFSQAGIPFMYFQNGLLWAKK